MHAMLQQPLRGRLVVEFQPRALEETYLSKASACAQHFTRSRRSVCIPDTLVTRPCQQREKKHGDLGRQCDS
jgi:hypothetical protein